MTGYIEIDWADVRAGDVLMHENGDRLTVYSVAVYVTAAGITRTSVEWNANGFAPHRKRPELPTADGTYVSLADWGRRRPSAVTLYSHQPDAPDYGWEWAVSEADGWRKASRDELPDDLVPLVPMPTEEQVREAHASVAGDSDVFLDAPANHKLTAAVMALLRGGDDD